MKVLTDDGYARLVFKLDHEVKANVSEAWPILKVSFAKPVDVSVDRVSGAAVDYISAARRDPDGTTIRLALKRRLKINTTPAGDRLFVDLLPESWKGVLPGLPKEVIAELAQRASEADRLLHRQRLADQLKTPTIRVKVATQPTFNRYVFEMPDGVNVVPERSKGTLKLNFDRPIKWDLADAKVSLPPTLKSVDADTDFGAVTVTFTLNGSPEVRTFREDRSIVVDIGLGKPKPKSAAAFGGRQVGDCRRRSCDRSAENRAGRKGSAGQESQEDCARRAGQANQESSRSRAFGGGACHRDAGGARARGRSGQIGPGAGGKRAFGISGLAAEDGAGAPAAGA